MTDKQLEEYRNMSKDQLIGIIVEYGNTIRINRSLRKSYKKDINAFINDNLFNRLKKAFKGEL